MRIVYAKIEHAKEIEVKVSDKVIEVEPEIFEDAEVKKKWFEFWKVWKNA